MARKPRIEHSENVYHVINRGNYRSHIFRTEGAKKSFELTLVEACKRSGWKLMAYCILDNHFHLCLATPKGNLSEGMRWLQATFAARFNRLRDAKGHLFQGRFKSLLVERADALQTLIDYIHLNPLRAGLERDGCLGSYGWSSLPSYLRAKKRVSWLDRSWLSFRTEIKDTAQDWAEYAKLLQLRSSDDPKEISKLETAMNRGWCIGSETFKRAVAAEHMAKAGPARMAHTELKEFNRLQWDHYLRAAMSRLGKSASDLSHSARSEPWKLAIASRMKQDTSVSNQWLCEKLRMGTPNGVSSNCGVYRRKNLSTCPHAKKLTDLDFGH